MLCFKVISIAEDWNRILMKAAAAGMVKKANVASTKALTVCK
jgi:hypothetical protein